MTRHRIFIAINLPAGRKKELADFSRKWSELPVRWTKENGLHLTLAFLGYLNDEELVKICQTIKEIGSKHSPFSINFTEISYGPEERGIPRLIWLKGEKSEELSSLKKDLDKFLSEVIGFIPENRDFIPHITLARIRKWEWQRIEPEERPGIPRSFSSDFEVQSIEVMESELKRGGAEYTVLESIKLEKL